MKKLDAAAVHERQRQYISEIESQGFDYGVVVAQAFIKSIRDIGYKSTGTALNELVDNSIEAGATNVHVAFGYTEGSKKPIAIATMDDGIGMIPGMLRAAVVWGGTDRHGSRDLFGRFGYGLPSASVSQGRRLSVYSRDESGEFYRVLMDLDDIEAGKYMENNRVVVPKPEKSELPDWVMEYGSEHFPGGLDRLGTVVVWEKLDRTNYKTTKELDNHILETFGITYRNVLRTTSIGVNGKAVAPVDPLFTTPGARFYDLDEDRAIPDEPISFEVRDPESRESLGWVKVRFSLMPPTFARLDKRRTDSNRSNLNKRFAILKEHNGVIVLRNGRQIDVVTKGAPTTFRNNDRYVGLEVDFPPTLDEFFGVTTHKQQITINEKIWGLLNEAGVWKVFSRLRKQWDELNDDLQSQFDSPGEDGKRPSEIAMEEADELDFPTPRSQEREEEAEKAKEKAIDEVMTEKEVPREEAEREVELVEKAHPYRVEIESLPGAPFYRAEQRGMQVVLQINRAHPFFGAVYTAVPGAEGARVRQGIEVLLFVLAKAELEAVESRKDFYESERQLWSMRLATGLAKLSRHLDLNPEINEGSDLPLDADQAVEAG